MVFFPVASRELTGAEGGDWSSKAYRAFNWAVRVEIWGGRGTKVSGDLTRGNQNRER